MFCYVLCYVLLGVVSFFPSLSKQPTNEAIGFFLVFFKGAGDKKHLGGFTVFDVAGVSPSVWKYMVETLGVHSLLDVGCGRGTSATCFSSTALTFCAPRVVSSHDLFTRSGDANGRARFLAWSMVAGKNL